MKFDLIIKGGRVFDPASRIDKQLDIAISGEKIIEMKEDLPSSEGKKVIDASGKIVTPGLIDLHTHVYWGISR